MKQRKISPISFLRHIPEIEADKGYATGEKQTCFKCGQYYEGWIATGFRKGCNIYGIVIDRVGEAKFYEWVALPKFNNTCPYFRKHPAK